MLVLSRKSSETICFPGTGISVKVLEIKGGQVRLGISAPSDVKILRGELAVESEGQVYLETHCSCDESIRNREPVNV